MTFIHSLPGPRQKQACWLLLVLLCLAAAPGRAASPPKQIGPGLYAYISDNDSSANSTFLVGNSGILVVDTGFDSREGEKLLQAIRSVSSLPVRYIVNTHYHRDHQGANTLVGPSATVISTGWTREHTLGLIKSLAQESSGFRAADITFEHKLTIYLEPYFAEVYFPGKAHTSGDVLVYFPQQRVMAMGDLFLNNSSPAMDQGSVKNWIVALDEVLGKPIVTFVPGHFELATREDVQRFRDYLHDLYEQVLALYQRGATVKQVRKEVHMEKYASFRQYPQFEATFADNAETIYQQIREH